MISPSARAQDKVVGVNLAFSFFYKLEISVQIRSHNGIYFIDLIIKSGEFTEKIIIQKLPFCFTKSSMSWSIFLKSFEHLHVLQVQFEFIPRGSSCNKYLEWRKVSWHSTEILRHISHLPIFAIWTFHRANVWAKFGWILAPNNG